MRKIQFRQFLALAAVALTLAFVAGEAMAAPRLNIGSRGSKTFSAPPPTATAPNTARPIERSMTQPTQPGAATAARPTMAPSPTTGFFNRPGFFGGLFAGFLGAGLLGMLFGHGFMGGLGGMASMLGLILQLGLVAVIGYFIYQWWQRRNQTATAYAGAPHLRDMMGGRATGGGGYMGGAPRAMGLGGGSAQPKNPDEIGTQPSDFDAFERLLGEIQTAYSNEDLGALRARVTPEILSYFSEDLADNASRGVVNRISGIKLLQGDLSEAWREGNADYATVAMRFSRSDQMVERASGRVIETDTPETTQLWTFRRTLGGAWMLSAIQET